MTNGTIGATNEELKKAVFDDYDINNPVNTNVFTDEAKNTVDSTLAFVIALG